MINPNRKKAFWSNGSRYVGYREYTIDELLEALSLVYTPVADCRRQSPTVLSLEQATTGAIASCCPNALKSSASINRRPTERQNDPYKEFNFKCEIKFEFKFLDWLALSKRNNIVCDSWMTHILSACYRDNLYAWVESRYCLASAYHLFQSFRRCFSKNSSLCGFCNQSSGSIHKFVILDV